MSGEITTIRAEHNKMIERDLKCISEDQNFLRMLGQGFKTYLGSSQRIGIQYIDVKHNFDNDYPLQFDMTISIDYEEKVYRYSLHFLAQICQGGKVEIKFSGHDMTYQMCSKDEQSANKAIYKNLETEFKKLFGLRGAHDVEAPAFPLQQN